jgi:hypothetical protein
MAGGDRAGMGDIGAVAHLFRDDLAGGVVAQRIGCRGRSGQGLGQGVKAAGAIVGMARARAGAARPRHVRSPAQAVMAMAGQQPRTRGRPVLLHHRHPVQHVVDIGHMEPIRARVRPGQSRAVAGRGVLVGEGPVRAGLARHPAQRVIGIADPGAGGRQRTPSGRTSRSGEPRQPPEPRHSAHGLQHRAVDSDVRTRSRRPGEGAVFYLAKVRERGLAWIWRRQSDATARHDPISTKGDQVCSQQAWQ